MTILETLISTHALMAKILIYALLIVLALPNFFKNDITKVVFYTRIGYFTFWAAWTIVVFSGLLAFAVERGALPPAVFIMIAISIILPAFDIYRAVKLKKIWLKGENGLKFSNIIIAIELLLSIAVVIIAIKYK